MTGKITIDSERCKGCGLCVSVCKRHCIVISAIPNAKGYYPAQPIGDCCTGCRMCGLMCPDVAITVEMFTEVVASPEQNSTPPTLTGEK